jgi:hypothetical protein
MSEQSTQLVLKTLTIRKFNSYEHKEGYEAKMEWVDGLGQEITVVLDEQVSVALMEFAAPLLTKFAADSARKMENALLTAVEMAKGPAAITMEAGRAE